MVVGMAGWYHPYCRLFKSMLSSCEWFPIPGRLKDRGLTAWSIERAMTDMIMEDLVGPGPNLVQSLLSKEEKGRQKYIDSYRELLKGATNVLTDRRLDFTVIHLPVPHTPPIYNRST